MNRRLFACVAATVLLGSCSTSGSDEAAPPSTTAPPTTSSSTTEATTTTTEADDPVVADPADCPSADEVGALLDSEVDRTPTVGFNATTDGLSYSTEGCSYDLADGAGSVSVARIVAEEDDDGDEPLYLRLEAQAETDAIADGFEPIPDLGDDAYRDGTDIVVRYGERMMFVGFDSFDEVDDDELSDRIEVAEMLAGKLVPLDLDQDEASDCTAIEETVDETVGTVSDSSSSGSAVGVDDVSISAQGCALDLQDGRELSVNVADSDQWDAWVEAKQDSSFTTTFTLAALGELSAYDTGDTLIVNEGEQPLEVGTADLDLDAGAAADLRLGLARLALGR